MKKKNEIKGERGNTSVFRKKGENVWSSKRRKLEGGHDGHGHLNERKVH